MEINVLLLHAARTDAGFSGDIAYLNFIYRFFVVEETHNAKVTGTFKMRFKLCMILIPVFSIMYVWQYVRIFMVDLILLCNEINT